MVVGTVAVRAELPTDNHITDAQIQEALWNYYYDIEKSVSYLTNKYITKPKTPKKEASKPTKKIEGKPISILQDAGGVRHGKVLDPGRPIVLFCLSILV